MLDDDFKVVSVTHRSPAMIIKPNEAYQEQYDKVLEDISKAPKNW